MTAKKAKITQNVIKAMKPSDIVWDTDVSGFGVRCQVKAVVYVLKKRVHGRQRWLTIGKHGEPWTPERARDRAKVLLGLIADNIDPAKMRDELKGRPTVKELCSRFIDDYAKEHKKQSSIDADKMNIKNHVEPLLGKMFVADVTLSDIDAFKRAVRSGKTARGLLEGKTKGSPVKGGSGAANRCLALLSKMFNLAIKWGLRPDNPVTHVEKYKERKIERYLSEVEYTALAEALGEQAIAESKKEKPNPYPWAAIKLLIFTGARRNEILTLKWEQVDIENSIIQLEDSKTGAKSIYINAPAKEVLVSLPKQKNNPYVICGTVKGKHLIGLRKAWLRLRNEATLKLWVANPKLSQYMKEHLKETNKKLSFKQARSFLDKEKLDMPVGLQDVRIHDLRHSFASVAAMGGMSLPMIGKLLGHTQTSTTARYAHLADDPVKQANEAIGSRIGSLMSDKPQNLKLIGK